MLKMQNKIFYSYFKIPKTYLYQNEHRTESFGKQYKVHRNSSSTYNK